MRNLGAALGFILILLVAYSAGYAVGKSDQPISVSGRIDGGFFKSGGELHISFNGDEALTGTLDNRGSGNFVGTWKDEPVSAICSGKDVDLLHRNITCQVSLNGKITTLNFTNKEK